MMVLDYSERRQVNKNRPKSRPVGLLFVAFFIVAAVSFASGVLIDRFVLKPGSPKMVSTAGQSVTGAGAKSSQGQAPSTSAQPATQANQPHNQAEPALTFYETLPKGGKAILGSGINPKKDEGTTAKPSSPAPTPQLKEQTVAQPKSPRAETAPPVPVSGNRNGKEEPANVKASTGPTKDAVAKNPQPIKGKFAVQVASSKDKKEAEMIKAKLAAKGFAAYIVESNIPDKGIWYRVRVGRQMEQSSANETATMIGKGALVIPE